MSDGLLVEQRDGTFTRKQRGELQPEDRVVFDGPGAFASTDQLQRELDAEIAAAGGLEVWRATVSVHSK